MALVKTNWLDAETVENTTTDPEEVTGATRYGLQTSVTGSPTGVQVHLEGSIDSTNWLVLVNAGSASGGLFEYGHGANDSVVKFIRLRLDQLEGGTSPTVTASVVAA